MSRGYHSEATVPSVITANDLSVIRFAEEIGNVRVWGMLIERYREDVLARGTHEALEFHQASQNRLMAARRYEDEHGAYALLCLEHAFNLALRHKSSRTRAAYERYGPKSFAAPKADGSENEISSTLSGSCSRKATSALFAASSMVSPKATSPTQVFSSQATTHA